MLRKQNIYYWKSEELPDERINSIKTSNDSVTPNLDYYGTKTRAEFNENKMVLYLIK